MIVLVLLLSFAGVVEGKRPLRPAMAVWWGALLMAGGASFGTGLGIAAAFPLVVVAVVPRERRTWLSILVLGLAPVLTLAVYVVLRSIPPPPPVGTPTCCPGAGWSLRYPRPSSCRSTSSPLAPAPWCSGSSASIVGIRMSRLLLAAAYGSIAVGRASAADYLGVRMSQEGTWIRYHYFPTAILTILVGLALGALHATGRLAAYAVYGAAGLWLAGRLVMLVSRPLTIDHHDFARNETEAVVRSIRAAIDAAPPTDTVRIENRPFKPTALIVTMSPGVFPGWAGVFAIFFPGNVVDGRPVRFVVSHDDWRWARERGGRMAELVVRTATP